MNKQSIEKNSLHNSKNNNKRMKMPTKIKMINLKTKTKRKIKMKDKTKKQTPKTLKRKTIKAIMPGALKIKVIKSNKTEKN